MGRLLGVSPLGDYDSPLQLLIYMTAIKPIARVLIKLPKWGPRLENGRAIQVCSCMYLNMHPPELNIRGAEQSRSSAGNCKVHCLSKLCRLA